VQQEPGNRQQVKVNILDQSFTLVTSGDPAEMIALAAQVDELMHQIARKSPNLDSTRVAVFACLHLAGQLKSRASEMDGSVRRLALLLDEVLEARP
jgi:cell division protein ZapA (FtsZ GTPase activity inhibitor)